MATLWQCLVASTVVLILEGLAVSTHVIRKPPCQGTWSAQLFVCSAALWCGTALPCTTEFFLATFLRQPNLSLQTAVAYGAGVW